MDQWQKEHITKNLHELITLTKFNVEMEAKLEEANVISREDSENIQADDTNKGSLAASKKLFSILLSKAISYEMLGKAAFETRQSGTFLILLSGVVHHLLQKDNIQLDELAIREILRITSTKEESLQFFLDKLNTIQKGHLYSWISPEHGKLYIPRRLSNRVQLNEKAFKENCEDVFIFKGITRSDLTKLVTPKLTTLSRTTILEKRRITSKIVLLERDEHWKHIVALCSAPAHLIEYDRASKTYILQQSTKLTRVVSSHLETQMKTDTPYISEEEFLLQLGNPENRRSICICDIPGMGKTWLLENIARGLQRSTVNTFVAFIPLPNFLQKVNPLKHPSLNATAALHLVLRYLTHCPLTLHIMEEALRHKAHLELFLDGYDEIPSEHLEWTKGFFTNLLKNKDTVRLLVTSRPHLRKDLEKTLGAMPYDILPLTVENQVECIVRIWEQSLNISCEKQLAKLHDFAKECLEKFKKSLTKEESDLMGIPLQCFLLASISTTNAYLYCTQEDSNDTDEFTNITAASMYEMYHQYLEMGIKKALSSGNQNEDSQGILDNEASTPIKENDVINVSSPESLKAYHVWRALKLLVPEVAEDLFQQTSLPDKNPSPQHFACGLVLLSTGNEGDPGDNVNFLHRSFAEYLVADYFAEVVTGQRPLSIEDDDVLQKHAVALVQDILSTKVRDKEFNLSLPGSSYYLRDRLDKTFVTLPVYGFENQVIACCLNAGLDNRTVDSIPASMAIAAGKLFKARSVSEVLIACVTSGYTSILKLVKHFYCEALTMKVVSKEDLRDSLIYSSEHYHQACSRDDYYRSCCAYLCLATKYSNVATVLELYSFFGECLQENLDDICSSWPTDDVNPLHYALQRHDYYLVEFFIERISLPQRAMLYHCVEYTAHCTQDELKSSTEMCKLLLGKCKSLLYESFEDCESPLVADDVHVELVKFLIHNGADLRALDSTKKNILMKGVRWWEPEEFSDFCVYLIETVKAFDLFQPNASPSQQDPLVSIAHKIDEAALKSILQIPGMKTSYLTDLKDSLILPVVHGGGKLSVIKELLRRGVNAYAKTSLGEGVLHFAAGNGDIDLISFFLSLKMSLEDKDALDNTPLLCAPEHLEMVKFLVSQNANVLALNNQRCNIAHAAAEIGKCDVLDYLATLPLAGDLFREGNSDKCTPLHIALADRFSRLNNDTLERVLHLPKVNVNAKNSKKENYFLLATRRGRNVDTLEIIRKAGTSYNAVTGNGEGALHLVVESGSLEVAEYLVSTLRIPLETKDTSGETAILKTYEDLEMLKFFLSKGADVLAVDDSGNNVAHKAAGYWQSAVFNHLVTLKEAAVLFRAKNGEGDTPLHILSRQKEVPADIHLSPVLELAQLELPLEIFRGNKEFLRALTFRQNVTALQISQKAGIPLNSLCDNNKSPLHLAAERGDGEDIQYLLSLGLPLEHQDEQGNTPLLLAAEHMEAVEYLLSQNADILASDNKGDTIAHKVREANQFADWMMTQDTDRYHIFTAVNEGGRTPIQEWIAREVHVDVGRMKDIFHFSGYDVNAGDKSGQSLFLIAAGSRCGAALLELLCKLGADSNQVDLQGRNAFHMAVDKNRFGNVRYLSSIKVPRSIPDKEGNTPLLLAAKNLEMLKLLVSLKARILDADRNGNNVAHKAAHFDNCHRRELVTYLSTLEQGSDLFERRNSQNRTPLQEWMEKGAHLLDAETLRHVLTSLEIEVNSVKDPGDPLFLTAVQVNNGPDIMQVLLSFQADRNTPNKNGDNALHLAVVGYTEGDCSLETVKYLITIGCSRDQKNRQGQTPLDVAMSLARRDEYKSKAKRVITILRNAERKPGIYFWRQGFVRGKLWQGLFVLGMGIFKVDCGPFNRAAIPGFASLLVLGSFFLQLLDNKKDARR